MSPKCGCGGSNVCVYEVLDAKAAKKRAVEIAQKTKNEKPLWALADTLGSVVFEQWSFH